MPSCSTFKSKKTKVCFNYTILIFCLTIYLEVEDSGKLFLNAKKVTERGLELRC